MSAHTDEEYEALCVRHELVRAHWRHPWHERDGWVRCADWDCVREAALPDGWGPLLFHIDHDPRGAP